MSVKIVNMYTRRARRFAGFSLIELLVVIAIIGLLSTLVLVSLNSARLRARDTRRISDLRTIQTALEFYDEACGQYPQPSPLNTNDSNGCPSGTDLGTFIPSIPTDPGSGAPYLYTAYALGTPPLTLQQKLICNGGYHLAVIFEGQPPAGAACAFTSGVSCTGGNYKGTGTNGLLSGTLSASGGDFDAMDPYCDVSLSGNGYNYIYDITGS